jgi:hypothetical protein
MHLLHGNSTVSAQMMGCWHRRYIRFRDGKEDTATRVIWLQTASGMGDMRIPGDRIDLSHRADLKTCTRDELVALSDQDSGAGITLLDSDAKPMPTATWEEGNAGVGYQNYVYFPEPGWFEWRAGDCMMEFAPSGTYEEDWRLQPNSRGRLVHLVGIEPRIEPRIETRIETEIEPGKPAPNRQLLLAGDHVMAVRDRSVGPLEERPLPETAAALGDDHASLVALLDCEFSYARRRGDHFVIELSSLPFREGQTLDLSWLDALQPDKHEGVGAAEQRGWRIESWMEDL